MLSDNRDPKVIMIPRRSDIAAVFRTRMLRFGPGQAKEVRLSDETVALDMLVVNGPGTADDGGIGRIFCKRNLIFSKGAGETFGKGDYRLAMAYAFLYSSDTDGFTCDLSVSLAQDVRPDALLAYFQARFRLERTAPGIYRIDGAGFPLQALVACELEERDRLSLQVLRDCARRRR